MKQRHLVLALLSVLAVILYIDRVCISIALPAIQKDLALEPEQLGWISLAFSIAYAVFEIPSGHLGDRYGARSALARITVAWSAFTALTGAAFGFAQLLVTRFLFGAGEAGAWPNASAVVAKWFPAKARARAMGVFGAATTIGGGLSPFLVIPIQHAYGWRASFVVFALAGVAWALVWWLWFRDAPSEMHATPAELAELPPVPAHSDRGLVWSVALRKPTLWALFTMSFTNIHAAFFAVFWLPTYLAKARGFDDDDLKWIAITWVMSGIGNVAGGALSDALVKRIGRGAGRRVIGIAGMLVVSLGLLAVTRTQDKQLVLIALSVCGFSWGVIQANSFATCIDVGGAHVGTIAGAMNTGGQLGGALSAIGFGYLVKASGSYDVPVLVMAAGSMLGALAWRWIDASAPIVEHDH
ncbi:MAG: MFS transporter [Kofleriaceae bacterium]